ncbi:hypothetical protein AMK59_1950, partial [Oryctes borbonicus]
IYFQKGRTECHVIYKLSPSKDTEGYSEVVKKIKEICTINKSLLDQSLEEDAETSFPSPLFRKISLSCEPYYNTSPTLPPTSQSQLSPLSSCFSTPPLRSRFSVSKVSDTVSKPVANSRFKVVAVSTVDLRNHPTSKISIVEEEYDDIDDEDEDDDNNGQFQNVRGSVSSIDSVESLATSAIDNVSDSSTPACESE